MANRISLTRRQFLHLSGAWALQTFFPLGRGHEQGGPRYNVLFLAVDDLRPQLGCYGYSEGYTPHIDRLAATGMVFRRAYCQMAVCTPSRASLLTGLRPESSKVLELRDVLAEVNPHVVTLPQLFRENGYTTLSIGKVFHHGYRDHPPSWSRNLDHLAKRPTYHTPAALQALQERWEQSDKKLSKEYLRGLPTECADVEDEAYEDGALAQEGIRLLEELRDQPFFLAIGFKKPHLPFCAPKRYWDLYDRRKLPLAPNPYPPLHCPPIALHNWEELRAYIGIPSQGPLSEEQQRELVHGYFACISYVDQQVGKLLDTLDRLHLAERTLVVLWGDHGWQLGEHGLWCKHTNFETSTWSPLIVRVPGVGMPGTRCDALVEFVDIYPTLAELAQLPPPANLEGTSFVPLLHNPHRPWKTAAFSQYPRGRGIMGYSMRTPSHRITRWDYPDGRQEWELYDHRCDPGENINLAGQPEYAQLVAELAAQLQAGWRAALPPGDSH